MIFEQSRDAFAQGVGFKGGLGLVGAGVGDGGELRVGFLGVLGGLLEEEGFAFGGVECGEALEPMVVSGFVLSLGIVEGGDALVESGIAGEACWRRR